MGRSGTILIAGLVVFLGASFAGCSAAPGPAAAEVPRLREAGELQFGSPRIALQSCGPATGYCQEPSVAVGKAGTLVANSNSAPFARSTDGATFVPLAGPKGAAVRAGGDGLVQSAPDGSIWWSVLEAQAFHVAHTVDAGLTWDVDATAPLNPPPDRQWLLFGPDRIVLTYQGASVWGHVSTDGGRTWSAAVPVAPQAHVHGRGMWCQDRFLVPFLDHGTVAVAASTDGVAWSATTIPDSNGTFFPMLSCESGHLAVAWLDLHQHVRLARSEDGGASWQASLVVSLPGETAVESPWLVLRDAKAWVAYFTADQDVGPAALRLVRVTGDLAERGTAAQGILTTVRKDRPGNSDFPQFDLDGQGHAVLVYADGDKGIKLLIST